MTSSRKFKNWVAVATLFLTLGWATNGWSISVGPNAGSSNVFNYSYSATQPNWEVGTAQNPVDVVFNPQGDYWLKLLGNSPVTTIGTTYQLVEHLTVGEGGVDWTDWHESFLTRGFEWTGGTITIGSNAVTAPGLSVVINASSPNDANNSITFNFDALTPGTTVTITKTFAWTGVDGTPANWPGGGATGPYIALLEYPTTRFPEPTIPEPATLSLIAVGGGLLGLMRRRRPTTGA